MKERLEKIRGIIEKPTERDSNEIDWIAQQGEQISKMPMQETVDHLFELCKEYRQKLNDIYAEVMK
jgi:hypothetical protein